MAVERLIASTAVVAGASAIQDCLMNRVAFAPERGASRVRIAKAQASLR